jgi:hypothetical protein
LRYKKHQKAKRRAGWPKDVGILGILITARRSRRSRRSLRYSLQIRSIRPAQGTARCWPQKEDSKQSLSRNYGNYGNYIWELWELWELE